MNDKHGSASLSFEFLRQLVEIAEKRSQIMAEMRNELLAGNIARVIELAKILTGVSDLISKEEICKKM